VSAALGTTALATYALLSSGDSQIDLAFGLGIDIRFANSVDFRISGGLGDIEGIALGIAVVR